MGALLAWSLAMGVVQGFTHCSAMCGPFVLAFGFTMGREKGSPLPVAPHLWQQGGRVAGFTVLGVAAGAVGSFVNLAGKVTGLDTLAAVIGGGLMLLWAVDQVRTGHGGGALERFSLLGLPGPRRALTRLLAQKTPGAALGVGLLLALHPCGLLLAMLVSAAATGSPLAGGLTLMAFGVATAPALLLVAAVGAWGRARLSAPAFRYVSGGLVAAAGLLFLLRGLSLRGILPQVNPWLF
jgi:sulfite exporter TauE/SafE